IFLVADPIVALISFTAAFFYLFFFKYGSVASFIFLFGTAITEIILAILFKDSILDIILILGILLLILWAHRSNIVRLFKGTESDINIRRQLKKKKDGKLLK